MKLSLLGGVLMAAGILLALSVVASITSGIFRALTGS
jgi:hypothetical protein